MTRSLRYVAFFLGLAAICWVGTGYVGSNAPALAITALIGCFYLMGGWELTRFQQATDSLARALAELGDATPDLRGWLATVHPALQNAVRLRQSDQCVAIQGRVSECPVRAFNVLCVRLRICSSEQQLGRWRSGASSRLTIESGHRRDRCNGRSRITPVRSTGFGIWRTVREFAPCASAH